jgi:hypothetical protein
MATSLISTGVEFADATVQTTAAVAGGGSAEIVASGALSDGSTVVINADGTVSVVVLAPIDPPVVGASIVFESAYARYIASIYDSTNQKVVIAYRDQGNSNYGTAIIGTVSGASISFGTAVVFESAASAEISVAYDSTNSKAVIFYQDGGNSFSGTAIVGTVSGTSISFGAATVFKSGSTTYIASTYDSTNNKLVIAYTDNVNSYYGTAIVGTISGTSISFGASVVFRSANVGGKSITYDFTNNKVILAYSDSGNSNFGTAVVGTVSGTSISFGTAVVFESAYTLNISTTYDSTNNKIVIAYRSLGAVDYGTAIVGTVSGTSISFGTAVVFESAITTYISATYDSINNKTAIAYTDIDNSGFGTAIVGTISGTSISFGTPVVFESASTTYSSLTYDLINDKFVIAYTDVGNSDFGTAVTLSLTGTTLTSENYIGVSNDAYTNGQTATIQLAGAVDDAQSGLTAGRSYYVQSDGTLSETPDTPSVFAGTAVSSTKLIIKG